jgi:ribosomal protein L16 Arg81 hydroxylase
LLNCSTEELLELHRKLSVVGSSITSEMQRSQSESLLFVREQKVFTEAVAKLQEDLFNELVATNVNIRNLFRGLADEIGHVVKSFISQVVSAGESVQDDLTKLSDDIRHSKENVIELQKSARKLFQEAVVGASGLASEQAKNWEETQGLATAVHQSLATLQNDDIQALFNTLVVVNQQLQASQVLIASMQSHQKSMDDVSPLGRPV